MAKYTGDIVANSLLRLPSNKAIVIDALLKSTVALANNQHLISKCNFETNDIMATFIVALCSRDEYNKMLDSALESLREKRAKGDERVLVAFFINPSDEDMPFGVAYDPYLGS